MLTWLFLLDYIGNDIIFSIRSLQQYRQMTKYGSLDVNNDTCRLNHDPKLHSTMMVESVTVARRENLERRHWKLQRQNAY